MLPSGNNRSEEPITPFDAAAYIYELVGEFERMARIAGFADLSRTLILAREQAAQAMIDSGRAAQARPKASDEDDSDDGVETA